MVTAAIIILSLAGLAGFYFATCMMQDKTVAMSSAMAHGSAGALGVVILAAAVFAGGRSDLSMALWVLAAALLGGLAIVALQILRKKPPSLLLMAHGTAGMIGIFVLASLAYAAV